MRYLRTKLATDWPEDAAPTGFLVKLAQRILPRSNPGYDGKLHLVREWLIEFDEEGKPWREIGLGSDGNPVLSGPDDENYGFWLDTNLRIGDVPGELIAADEFDRLWQECRT